MKIMIVGCGRLGSELAYLLFKRGQDVAVIDNVAATFNNLPSDFHGRLFEGEALNKDVLLRAGIETADALAAVTSSDATNAVIGFLANNVYHIPRVVVRNFNPHAREVFESFGLQVISSTMWGAQRMEEMIFHSEARTVFSAGNGEVEVYEITVSEEWNGRTLQEIVPATDCVVAALTRAGKAILPQMDTIVHGGDILTISATFEGIEVVRDKVCRCL